MPQLSLPHHLSSRPALTKLGSFIATASLMVGLLALHSIAQAQITNPGGDEPTDCPNEQPVTIPNVQKKLIQIGDNLSRWNICIKPDLIFLHATDGGDLNSNWGYFNSGAGGLQVNSHFIVGTDGTIYQTVELYQNMVEFAITNDPYNKRSIAIEMVNDRIDWPNKQAIPEAQYQATLKLVASLMSQYNIPIGDKEADWISDRFYPPNPDFTSGVYSHYQIHSTAHQDIGKQAFTDFRTDLKLLVGNSTGPSTGVGSGGRMVPYDRYARPYSWPISGVIRQAYGFTPEAQNLGLRYPGLYPIGDPNVIFSTTNHTEPPLDPLISKYINPNIDIAPDNNTAGSRAVYSTHAGWVTFADWAGPEKGYTIQIEADVEGDGQSDLATRYMRLQAPTAGFFAPDIAVFHPSDQQTQPALNQTCTSPANNDWANVNRWDEQLKQAIATINQVENITIPCNTAKGLIKEISGGVENTPQNDPNNQGYQGLMLVSNINNNQGEGSSTVSNCDRDRYDITTTQGNLNCGLQQLARAYHNCDDSWNQAILRYFTNNCQGQGNMPLSLNKTAADLLQAVNNQVLYLNSPQATTPAPAINDQANPTDQNPVQNEIKIPPIQTIEAEDMHIVQQGQGVEVLTDGAASAGKAIRFSDNTAIETSSNFKADRLMIVAKVDKPRSSFANLLCFSDPELQVLVEGQEIGKITVTSDIYKSYAIDPTGLDGSAHQISLKPTNVQTFGCQRQVWVDSLNYLILNPNTPTVEVISEVEYQAEDFTQTAQDQQDQNSNTIEPSGQNNFDNSASGGKYVKFTAPSRIEKEIDLPDSNYIAVRARGTICGENIPRIVVTFANKEVLKLGINNQNWTYYSTDLAVSTSDLVTGDPNAQNAPVDQAPTEQPTDKGLLAIEFTNNPEDDSALCQTQAFVDLVKFTKFQTSQSTQQPTSLIGKTKYVGYNQLIGYVSNSRGTSAERAEYAFNVDNADQNYFNTVGQVPNANQTYLSYRIMYNNPNLTTFPQPDQADTFINAKVDDPYIVETDDNKVAGSLKNIYQEPLSPMFFFCALRQPGDSVRCINRPNP